MQDWYTADEIAELWRDAPDDEFGELTTLVGAALAQVKAYAPALRADKPVPDNYREAQLMQTRNLWNAARVDAGGGAGEGEFILRPRPLDWQVTALLRPKRGVPVIG